MYTLVDKWYKIGPEFAQPTINYCCHNISGVQKLKLDKIYMPESEQCWKSYVGL